MSRNRWEQINRYLGFDLTWLKTELLQRFHTHWTLYPYISVDETLIKFKGRYRYRQHIKGKPHATGLKLYGLADQYGFLYDFWFYDGTKKHTLTGVVLEFAKQIPHPEHYVMVVDSLYGSYDLMEGLQQIHLHFIMACQQNHPTWLWDHVQDQQLNPKEWTWKVQHHQVMALSFKDKKTINFLTDVAGHQTVIKPKPTTIAPDATRQIPEVIHKYNQKMHGVDLVDQMINLYLPQHKQHSWKRAQFNALWYITVNNAWRMWIHLQSSGSSPLLEFLCELLFTLVGLSPTQTTNPKSNTTSSSPSHTTKRNNSHLVNPPSKKVATKSTTQAFHMPVQTTGTHKRCVQCQTQQIESKTNFHCSTCKVYLHPKCFVSYHS